MLRSIAVGCLIGFMVYGYHDQAHASDVLSPAMLSTPFGSFVYVLPEGYCAMDGRDGRLMSDALDAHEPPPAHSLGARFLPCSDRRSLYESHNWPLEHAEVRISFLDDSFGEGIDRVLWDMEYAARHAARDDRLAQDVLGDSLTASPDPSLPGRDGMIDDMRPVVREHWTGVWGDILREANTNMRGGFPLGRTQNAVWWAGFDHETRDQVLARVTASFVWHGFRVDMSMERPFRGVDTFDGMVGDLQPAVEATIVVNGPLYWIPSKERLSLDNRSPDTAPPPSTHDVRGQQ